MLINMELYRKGNMELRVSLFRNIQYDVVLQFHSECIVVADKQGLASGSAYTQKAFLHVSSCFLFHSTWHQK